MSTILVTGGTGSFGHAFVRAALDLPDLVDITPRDAAAPQFLRSGQPCYDRVIVFSRDELKQHEMRQAFPDPRLRWFIGDVRDRGRLELAMEGVDVVVHAAAMKQVDTCEYNPLEAKKTNVDGAENVILAARRAGVGRVLALGTDKSVDPTNMYGATKLMAEKLFVDANESLSGTRFACTRYGNVLDSRGSVLPLFRAQHARGDRLSVTDPAMTRFVLTLEQGVGFVLDCLGRMRGGEVFVPRLPAVTLRTLAAAVTWPEEPRLEIGGLRAGEKMHELLVSVHESDRTAADGIVGHAEGFYVIHPHRRGERVSAAQWHYGSDNAQHLDVAEFRELAGLSALSATVAV